MTQIDQVLRLAEVFASARGISEARVSTIVFNDGKRLRSLREGKDMGVRSAIAAHKWFSANWPSGANWPADVPRPSTQSEPVEKVA
jgi:hypothetical protein